jgi:hypothetical protein
VRYKTLIRNQLKKARYESCVYFGNLWIAGAKRSNIPDVQFYDPKTRDWEVSREYLPCARKRAMKRIERLFYINRVGYGVMVRIK